MLLTIQHNNSVFTPPVEEGVKIEWERTGSPGKLTFTVITPPGGGIEFTEGDPVCFYYDDKGVFMGYIFTKKHDREGNIEVTCYDQIRYLKNKYTYVFENKTASQIIKALCDDFNLHVGKLENTSYVIPAIVEENISALDITLDVLEETLLNTGNMFVLYDNFGNLELRNVTNCVSETLICDTTAENYDYSSSIDDETYNSIVLYYKKDDELIQIFSASSPTTMKQWGTLRYFEEVKSPTIGQNKANSLLKLYNKKTRELKITDAFGDVSVRGGTMIPVQLKLHDAIVNNYMIVEKVTHKFDSDQHIMDLTLEGSWEDQAYDVVSATVDNGSSSGGTTASGNPNASASANADETCTVTIHCNGIIAYAGVFQVNYTLNGVESARRSSTDTLRVECDKNSFVTVKLSPKSGNDYGVLVSNIKGNWATGNHIYTAKVTKDCGFTVKWIKTDNGNTHTGSSGTDHGGGGSGF